MRTTGNSAHDKPQLSIHAAENSLDLDMEQVIDKPLQHISIAGGYTKVTTRQLTV